MCWIADRFISFAAIVVTVARSGDLPHLCHRARSLRVEWIVAEDFYRQADFQFCTSRHVRDHPYMTAAKCLDFLLPSPLCPQNVDVISGWPLMQLLSEVVSPLV